LGKLFFLYFSGENAMENPLREMSQIVKSICAETGCDQEEKTTAFADERKRP